MSAFLFYQSKEETQKFLCGPLLTIGRKKTNNIVLSDQKVSRNHLLLRCLGKDQYYLIDMGSVNGTYLNDKRIIVPTLLKHGDVIKAGSTDLTFNLEEDESVLDKVDGTDDLEPTFAVDALSVSEITVLVADIRDYTSMSEQIPIDFLAKLIGQWFRSVNDCVERNNGVVDKFIGDAVMACWLMSKDDPEKSIKETLKAAYELYVMTEELNQAYPQLPNSLRIGVGINTGEAIVGDMGSGRLQDYTVLGDAVNLAFHLEKASKELKTDVVISHNSLKYLKNSSRENRHCSIKVKGKDDPVRVYPLTFQDLYEIVR